MASLLDLITQYNPDRARDISERLVKAQATPQTFDIDITDNKINTVRIRIKIICHGQDSFCQYGNGIKEAEVKETIDNHIKRIANIDGPIDYVSVLAIGQI